MQIALRQQIYGEESPAARPADGYSDRIAATQLPGIRRALGAFLTAGSSLILSGEFAFEESVAQLDAALGDAPLGYHPRRRRRGASASRPRRRCW